VARTMVSALCFGLLAVLLVSTTSYAQTPCGCWQVDTLEEVKCHSTGCDSSYPFEACGAGCSFGHCGATGFGLCCETSWKTYSVYGATECGGNQDCGNGCGLAPTRASSRTGSRFRWPSQSLRNVRAGAPVLDRNHVAHEEILFVPNRCQHTYGVLYPGDSGRQQTPTAIGRDGGVSSGGL